MRRLSAVLMIAALLAVMIPSATLAGKPPPPGIDAVKVYGETALGGCAVRVEAWYHGRAYGLLVTQQPGVTWGPWTLAKKATWVSFRYQSDAWTENLGSVAYTWSVSLTDRKGNPIGTALTAGPDDFDGSGCPERLIAEASS